MPEPEISSDVRQFLTESIRSVEQLEVLLLLRATADRGWTVRDVYQRVLTNETSIQRSVDGLHEKGLLRRTNEGFYQFKPTSDGERVLEELALLYKEKPARILYALYGPQRPEIDAFVQVFRIRKTE
jgi:predicted transcriptional regulator of viral defense system